MRVKPKSSFSFSTTLFSRETKAKAIPRQKELTETLDTIAELLRTEEEDLAREKRISKFSQGLGECMMYCFENKIFDLLCASILTDKPEGFMKIGLEKLINILSVVESPTTFASSNIKGPL